MNPCFAFPFPLINNNNNNDNNNKKNSNNNNNNNIDNDNNPPYVYYESAYIVYLKCMYIVIMYTVRYFFSVYIVY